jgi:hypothetical protein
MKKIVLKHSHPTALLLLYMMLGMFPLSVFLMILLSGLFLSIEQIESIFNTVEAEHECVIGVYTRDIAETKAQTAQDVLSILHKERNLNTLSLIFTVLEIDS